MMQIEPIGAVVGGRTEVADDYWGGVHCIIRLDAGFPLEVVQGLEEFSHLVVTWHFSKASPDDVALHARSPRNDPRWAPSGTFAHRNHRRPNQLATSFPRLIKVDGLDLHVTDMDAVDGTPIYDLAPYFPEMGPRGDVREPGWPGEMLKDYWAGS
ncbi:SAM-dependent methyltransferase [Streptomyces fructofermentans]|uniref:tRNA (N6-threonylcarbamoyladenosine(37)-N6)-methyltransferase TrmO n=1 Tax=Streptomyces fructofermentans TaxID=152141 RepID=A0A918U379_9ACTN|nr:SAM-dependent methyltransferase [Streptomyces fructofermentans]GGX84387.1 tRNA (N6-threonylcarbamoyladenosine(37)-N6)-methyltransferase TrmO [Streptomyces fructofermentans]